LADPTNPSGRPADEQGGTLLAIPRRLLHDAGRLEFRPWLVRRFEFRSAGERLAGNLGRLLSPGAIRQAALRARERQVKQLVRKVEDSLDDPTFDRVEEELSDQELVESHRPYLGSV
jgi:hypothetical protein